MKTQISSFGRLWPWLAAVFFWIGALDQLALIKGEGADGVSVFNWTLASITLFGYAVYYSKYVDKRGRLHAVTVSCISGTLYAAVALAALLA